MSIRKTQRQRFILSLMLEKGEMNPVMIAAVDPKKVSASATTHSMKKLFHEGLLEITKPREKGNASTTYKLSPAGEAVASLYRGFFRLYA